MTFKQFLAVAAVGVMLWIWMDTRTHARMDRMDDRITRIEQDVTALKVGIAEVLAILKRDIGGQSGGSTPAKPLAPPAPVDSESARVSLPPAYETQEGDPSDCGLA